MSDRVGLWSRLVPSRIPQGGQVEHERRWGFVRYTQTLCVEPAVVHLRLLASVRRLSGACCARLFLRCLLPTWVGSVSIGVAYLFTIGIYAAFFNSRRECSQILGGRGARRSRPVLG